MTLSHSVIAVIVDISRSRAHVDRADLQAETLSSFSEVNLRILAEQSLEPTVGDEFQAVYADLPTALRATLLARLLLPDGIDCRFGLGHGEVRTVGAGRYGPIQDGSAWWAARSAIEEAREREYSKLRFVRTWYSDGIEPEVATQRNATDAIGSVTGPGLVNAYLLARDHLVSSMKPRTRRLLAGQIVGDTQENLAKQEGISQSAVSQNLHSSGAAALLAGEALFRKASFEGGRR